MIEAGISHTATGANRRGTPRIGVVLLAVAISAMALTGIASATQRRGSDIPAPKGLPAFYSVPKPLPKQVGTLIKSQRIAATGVHGTIYRVMYVSKSELGKPVAVTGVVVVPKGKAPKAGFPVVTWGHGTNGMADQCAPSIDAAKAAPAVNDLLDQGWLVTASDYEGEGTPGLMPFLAGNSAAQNTIDIVRAARHLKAAHASSTYAVWGHSEGGQTAMFGLHIAAEYAPELHLKGVVAGAPPSQFNLIYTFLKTSPFRHYLMMAAGGLNAAYGDTTAPLDQVLKPAGLALVPELDKGCSGYLATSFTNVNIDDVLKGDPFTIPVWKDVLSANDPQGFTAASPTPLLIIQGGNDEQIPVASTGLLAAHLCSVGQHLERWIYPGQTHGGVVGPSLPDMIEWIKARFDGKDAPGSFTPKAQADIQINGCPS